MKVSKVLQQLRECVELVFSDFREQLLREIREARAQEDLTRPLTALELCERWQVTGESPEQQLFNLARKCCDWGLRPLQGTRGWQALYGRAAVLHAESFACGKSTRRRHAA